MTVLSVPFCAPLFEDIAPNVSFLGRAVKTQYRGIMGLFRLFKELHAMHFDRIVDAHDVLRTKVLRQYFRLSGYEVRVINKHRSDRRQLTAEPGKKVLQQLPTSFENYAEALWGGDFSGLSGGSGFSGVSGVSGLSSDSGFSGYSGVSRHSGLSSDSGHLPQGGGREGAPPHVPRPRRPRRTPVPSAPTGIPQPGTPPAASRLQGLQRVLCEGVRG